MRLCFRSRCDAQLSFAAFEFDFVNLSPRRSLDVTPARRGFQHSASFPYTPVRIRQTSSAMAFQVSASSVSTEAFRTLLVDPKADLSSDPPQGGAPRRPTAYLSFDVRTICSGHCCSADIRSLELRDCTGRGRRCGSNESGFLCRIASERTRALDSSLKMASLRDTPFGASSPT